MSIIYLIQTNAHEPDLTLRARRVLQQAASVVADDVRWATDLLRSAHLDAQPVGPVSLENIMSALNQGDVAWMLRRWAQEQDMIRQFEQRGIAIVPIPGPSDEMTTLIMSGLPLDQFAHLGSPPANPQRRRAWLNRYALERRTMLITVTAGQCAALQADLSEIFGDRTLAVGDGTSIWHGRTTNALPDNPAAILTLIIQGAETTIWSEEQVRRWAQDQLAQGRSARDIARQVAERSGWTPRQVYELLI